MPNVPDEKEEAELDEELEDTFPASDPPSITSPKGGAPQRPAPKGGSS